MGWFKLNLNDPEAQEHAYPDIPKFYRWENYQWRRRRNKTNAITRMYFVHPKDKERFCLRLLLAHVKGATSFLDLRTVPDPQNNNIPVIYPTFEGAALARQLLDDDTEWLNLLREAVVSQFPSQLRHLFAWILFHCYPSDPRKLWLEFSHHFTVDILRRLRGAQPVPDAAMEVSAKNTALSDINVFLKEMGSSLENYPLLFAEYTGEDIDQAYVDLQQQQDPIPPNNAALLNPAQRAAFDTVADAVDTPAVRTRLFFIDGPGGTGKSFLYNTLIAHILEQQKEVIVVASSGIAALILHGGRTAHSAFKIPLKIHADSTCNIAVDSPMAQTIRNASAIIWDEAPMTNRFIFEAVDRTIQDVTKVGLPFGGKAVIFGGDFRQVTPVKKRGTQTQIENASLKFSPLWPNVRTLKLTTNMRVAQDPENAAFVQFLLRVGEGSNLQSLITPITTTSTFLISMSSIQSQWTTRKARSNSSELSILASKMLLSRQKIWLIALS